jgi:hypothetical protein
MQIYVTNSSLDAALDVAHLVLDLQQPHCQNMNNTIEFQPAPPCVAATLRPVSARCREPIRGTPWRLQQLHKQMSGPNRRTRSLSPWLYMPEALSARPEDGATSRSTLPALCSTCRPLQRDTLAHFAHMARVAFYEPFRFHASIADSVPDVLLNGSFR